MIFLCRLAGITGGTAESIGYDAVGNIVPVVPTPLPTMPATAWCKSIAMAASLQRISTMGKANVLSKRRVVILLTLFTT